MSQLQIYSASLYPLFIRLDKITEMLLSIKTYSTLGLSHIEGIETLHSRFQLIISGMKKKQYDILDQRKTDFDADFEEFKRMALDIRVSYEETPPWWIPTTVINF